VRAFRGGQYANTPDGIVLILGYKNNRYQTVRIDRDEERDYFASGLADWSPQNGEQVVEAGNENSPTGTVVEAGEDISLVVWAGLLRHVSFVNSCLEPVWQS
jgi:hypothetical protein